MRNSEFYSRNKKHFIHSFSLTEGNLCYRRNLSTSAASSQYAKTVSLGEKWCASSFFFSLLFFFLLTLCKSGWWMERCSIWVVGIALTASLWPHWLFYFLTPVLKYVLRLIWTSFFCFSFFFFVDFLPSDTVGRFCSVWNMILNSFTHLNFRVREKKTDEYPVHSKHTYLLVKITNICFFFLKSQAMYIW